MIFVDNKKENITSNVKILNYLLEKLSTTNELITYIDLNEKLSISNYQCQEYLIDSVHLNGKGYEIWKNLIEKYVL